MIRRAIVCSVLLATAGGCSALSKQAYPAKDRFAVMAPSPTASSESAVDAIIRVNRLEVAPPFGETSFHYRTSERSFEPDYYNLFVAMPRDLLTAELQRTLTETGVFAAVIGPTSPIDTPLRVDGIITGLYGDFRDPNKPAAVLEGRFTLLNEGPQSTTAVGSWAIVVVEPLPDAAAESLAGGFGRALTRMSVDLAAKVKSVLPAPTAASLP